MCIKHETYTHSFWKGNKDAFYLRRARGDPGAAGRTPLIPALLLSPALPAEIAGERPVLSPGGWSHRGRRAIAIDKRQLSMAIKKTRRRSSDGS
jgi:hypothetical protein